MRERQAKWIGQVLHHDSLLTDIIEGRRVKNQVGDLIRKHCTG